MAATRQEKPHISQWYTVKRQRVKQANLSVEKDGVYERPGSSWTTGQLERWKARQAEPWNVEDVKITGRGIEVSQYGGPYDHNQSRKGPVVLVDDKIAWNVLFKSQSMMDIWVREWTPVASSNVKETPTFIEVCFKHEGVPESKDVTQLKTVGPEEARGTEMEEGGGSEEGEEAEEEEAEGEEAEEMEEEEEDMAADQFDLAKVFAEPTYFSVLKVRIAFVRSQTKRQPYQWNWPATFTFLRGSEGWTPKVKKADTEARVDLPLDRWMNDFGNKFGAFIAQPQNDNTTKWLVKQSRLDRQQPSTTGPAVPAFGVPLPKAPQPTSAPTPTPTRESSQGSRKRTLEEIDAEEEEIDREEERLRAEKERLRARRRQLREERKQAYKG